MTSAITPTQPVSVWETAADEAARTFDYGEVIPSEWLATALRCNPREQMHAYLQLYRLFKLRLQQRHQKDVHPNGGYDVLVVKPEEQMARSVMRMARKQRASAREFRASAACVNEAELSPSQVRALRDERARMVSYLENQESSLRQLESDAALTLGIDPPADGEDE